MKRDSNNEIQTENRQDREKLKNEATFLSEDRQPPYYCLLLV